MSTFKFEMHFHTEESSPCGKIAAKKGVELYQKAGYDGIVVTDHFSKSVFGGPQERTWAEICESFLKGYRLAKQSVRDSEFQVLLGMEIRFPDDDNDFLVYGIDEEFPKQHPWIYMKELSDLFDISKGKNLIIVQAHPFRDSCHLAPVEFLHGIEVYNGNPRHNSRNELAKKAAKKHRLLETYGSDFHQMEDIARTYIELDKKPETEQELVALLMNLSL